MWPFRSKQIVDDDASSWIVENFAWLIKTFGGHSAFSDMRLVLPKPGYFTHDGERDHEFAVRVFDQTKSYCGMKNWPVDLVVDHNPLAEAQGLSQVMIQHGKHALGTFQGGSERATISYVPALRSMPEQLIATLAHELSHFQLSATDERICEPDEEEFLTDLCGVFLGFGVFLANSRFQHTTISDGIFTGSMTHRSGYLPERDLIFALALFIYLKGLCPKDALSCLKPHLASLLKTAFRVLQQQTEILSELKSAVDFAAKSNFRPAPEKASGQIFYAWSGRTGENSMPSFVSRNWGGWLAVRYSPREGDVSRMLSAAIEM